MLTIDSIRRAEKIVARALASGYRVDYLQGVVEGVFYSAGAWEQSPQPSLRILSTGYIVIQALRGVAISSAK